MPILFYAHPFSSYCQKVLIALYENDTPFDCTARSSTRDAAEAQPALWPIGSLPVLVDDGAHGRGVQHHHRVPRRCTIRAGSRCSPTTPTPRSRCGCMDRFFDNYVMTPMQKIVSDGIRAPGSPRWPRRGRGRARRSTRAYGWLEDTLQGREWAAGDDLQHGGLRRRAVALLRRLGASDRRDLSARPRLPARLLARPSFARAVDEARPFRHLFPPGAPDRD